MGIRYSDAELCCHGEWWHHVLPIGSHDNWLRSPKSLPNPPDKFASRWSAQTICTIPTKCLPSEYLLSLCDTDCIAFQQASLLAWAVTSGSQVSREIQLHAFLAVHNGFNCLLDAGMGSGKTLPIALSILLDDPVWIGHGKDMVVRFSRYFNSKVALIGLGWPVRHGMSWKVIKLLDASMHRCDMLVTKFPFWTFTITGR